MKFLSEVKYLFFPERGHRFFLCLEAEDGASRFAVPALNGAFNHLVAHQLSGIDWDEARQKAFSHLGSYQPIQTIELDDHDLAHLTPYPDSWHAAERHVPRRRAVLREPRQLSAC